MKDQSESIHGQAEQPGCELVCLSVVVHVIDLALATRAYVRVGRVNYHMMVIVGNRSATWIRWEAANTKSSYRIVCLKSI